VGISHTQFGANSQAQALNISAFGMQDKLTVMSNNEIVAEVTVPGDPNRHLRQPIHWAAGVAFKAGSMARHNQDASHTVAELLRGLGNVPAVISSGFADACAAGASAISDE
jgi:hypothetical protein